MNDVTLSRLVSVGAAVFAAFVLHLFVLLGLSVLYFRYFLLHRFFYLAGWVIAYAFGFASAVQGLCVYGTVYKKSRTLIHDSSAMGPVREHLGQQSIFAQIAFVVLGLMIVL